MNVTGEEGTDVYILCDFDSVEASGNLQMKIFNSDTIQINEYQYEFRAPVDFDELWERGFNCTQRVNVSLKVLFYKDMQGLSWVHLPINLLRHTIHINKRE